MTLYDRRRLINRIAVAGCFAAAMAGLFFLALILASLLTKGVPGLSLATFTQVTPVPGEHSGGLLNAIAGSLILSSIAIAIGAPLGLLAGTYLAEYGLRSRFSTIVRFINDILLSAPSILIGLFINELLVVPSQHFSGWAGAIALALIVIPVVVRTTENMLLLAPNSLREAAAAIGLPRSYVILHVAYRAALAGLVTGVLLAIARISGETAPLLFTSLNNPRWSLDMNNPIASLPMAIKDFADSPYADFKQLAWTGALLITVAVLCISIFARSLTTQRKPK